jgi:hypothetical protein
MEDLKNLAEVIGKINMIPEGIIKSLLLGFKMGLDIIKEEARRNHPPWPAMIFNSDGTWRYHNITTNLTNSINLRMRHDLSSIEGEVGILAEFAQGGAMEYAGKIERDHPFIGPAVEAKKQEWERQIEMAIRSFFA